MREECDFRTTPSMYFYIIEYDACSQRFVYLGRAKSPFFRIKSISNNYSIALEKHERTFVALET